MKFYKIVLLVVALICSVLAAEQIEITLENGTKWTGEIGQSIVVHAVLGSKEKIFSGKLERVTESYLIVGGDFINVSEVLSITLRSEQETELVEGADGVDLGDAGSSSSPINEEKSVDSELKLAVIPLTGEIGFVHGEMSSEANWFCADHLEQMFKRAKNAGVKIVVLEINSPGGLVIERNKICDVIQKYRAEFKMVAYPHDAFSAASTVAMTCDEILAAPDSKIGAAVVLRGGDAVEKKYASADASVVRSYLLNANRQGEISDAFSIVSKELWFDKKNKKCASSELDDSGDWIMVDSADTILTLDSSELMQYEIAVAKVNSIQEYFPTYAVSDYKTSIDGKKKITIISSKKLEKSTAGDFSFQKQKDLDFWMEEMEDALIAVRADRDNEYKWDYLKKTEKEVRKRASDLEKESKKILKRYDRGGYDFYISAKIINALTIIRDTSKLVIDNDLRENIVLTKSRVNTIIEAMYSVWKK
ncbi:MAG: hypothetical protein HOI88_08650 [Phycisphaerae bacterium]|jgi:hypothetical protein|nr:hypothetical protein [Phycisphaerae bacterium]MBT6283128.1 hypothetical protein [Phycisphaerae bacterium]